MFVGATKDRKKQMFRVSFNFDTLLAEREPKAAPAATISPLAAMPQGKGLGRKDMCNLFFPNAKKNGQCARCRFDCNV
ncbi:MAG: hypothetical protein ACJA2X_001845 [Halocynthiibacter sp.]|jgi:hypothetical protein